MKKRTSKLRVTAVAIVVMAVGVIGGTNAASAASSYLYRNNGGSIFVSQSVNQTSGTLVRNGTGFTMRCWTTGPNTIFFGNYYTAKYFWGTVYSSAGTFNGYVTASVVGNQTSVGHC